MVDYTEEYFKKELKETQRKANKISNELLKVVAGEDQLVGVIAFEITRRGLMKVLKTTEEQEKRVNDLCDIIEKNMNIVEVEK